MVGRLLYLQHGNLNQNIQEVISDGGISKSCDLDVEAAIPRLPYLRADS